MGLNEDNDANMGETIIDNNRVYLGDLIIWGYNAYHAMGMVEMHSAKKNGDFGDGLWHWNCHFTLIQQGYITWKNGEGIKCHRDMLPTLGIYVHRKNGNGIENDYNGISYHGFFNCLFLEKYGWKQRT